MAQNEPNLEFRPESHHSDDLRDERELESSLETSPEDRRDVIERARLLPFLLIVGAVAALLLLSLRYTSQISRDRMQVQQQQTEEQQTSSTDAVAEEQRRSLSSLDEEQRRKARERAAKEEEVASLLDQLRGRTSSDERAAGASGTPSGTPSRFEGRRQAEGLTRSGTSSRVDRLEELRQVYYKAMQAPPGEAEWNVGLGVVGSDGSAETSSNGLSRIARVLSAGTGIKDERSGFPASSTASTEGAGGLSSNADLADRLLAQASGLGTSSFFSPDAEDEWANAPPSKRFARIEATTPYEVRAGTVIPCYLITETNSDQIGDISCQVYEDVYDQQGNHLLIPRGSRLLGRSESGLAFSASSLLALWHRLIYPDGRSLMLPGYDTVARLGQTGLRGSINRHWGRIIKAAVLVGIIGAGFHATQPTRGYYGVSPGQEAAASVARDLNRVTSRIIDQSLTPPTIYIPAGIPVLVYVNTDLVLPGAYPREWDLDGEAGSASFDNASAAPRASAAWLEHDP